MERLLYIGEIAVAPGSGEHLAERFLAERESDAVAPRSVYRSSGGERILELIALDGWTMLPSVLAARDRFAASVTPSLASDWHAQLLTFVEHLTPGAERVPRSPGLELRHIEVPLAVHAEYLHWRRSTLFPPLAGRPEIDEFTAYHSLLSTRPGVTFVVGFSTDPAAYRAAYETPEYREVLRQAGQHYIAGGLDSLHTEIFTRVASPVPA